MRSWLPWTGFPSASTSPLLIASTVGDHLNHDKLRRRFYAALKRADLRRVRFNDLRHCFASLAVQKLPISDVQGYLGHAHIATTMRYVHHAPGAKDAALLAEAIAADGVPEPGHNRDISASRDAGLNGEVP